MKIESFFSIPPTVTSFHSRCSFHKKATSEKIRSFILKNVSFFVASFGFTALILKKFPVSSPLLLIGQSILMIRLYEQFIYKHGVRLHQDMRMQKALSKAQNHLLQTGTPQEADPIAEIKAFLKSHVQEKSAGLGEKIEHLSNNAQYDLFERFLNKTFLPHFAMEYQTFYKNKTGVNLILLDRGAKVLGRPYIAARSIEFSETERQIPLKSRLSGEMASSTGFYGIEFSNGSGSTELLEIPFSILDRNQTINLASLQRSHVL